MSRGFDLILEAILEVAVLSIDKVNGEENPNIWSSEYCGYSVHQSWLIPNQRRRY